MDPRPPSISVCIPARNEAATVGNLIAELVLATRDRGGFIDELIVFDHQSTDDTARIAARHGARVIDADAVVTHWGPAMGKGDVLWRSLVASRGDIVVWVDADLTNLTWRHVRDLVTPLIQDRFIHLSRIIPRTEFSYTIFTHKSAYACMSEMCITHKKYIRHIVPF